MGTTTRDRPRPGGSALGRAVAGPRVSRGTQDSKQLQRVKDTHKTVFMRNFWYLSRWTISPTLGSIRAGTLRHRRTSTGRRTTCCGVTALCVASCGKTTVFV